MSYEGRVIYLCKHGHQVVKDCYDDYPNIRVDSDTGFIYRQEKKFPQKQYIKCPYCGAFLRRIGGVDDTNGDSVACFRLKTIRSENQMTYKLGSGADVIIVSHTQPPIYEVIYGKKDEFFNFDTGLKIG